jgi:hypothetical protein
MKLPTVKQLRYLVALDEFRHFGQAADACLISQSGFSIAIKELEDLLNVQDRPYQQVGHDHADRQGSGRQGAGLPERAGKSGRDSGRLP